jgi:hypothetical protein
MATQKDAEFGNIFQDLGKAVKGVVHDAEKLVGGAAKQALTDEAQQLGVPDDITNAVTGAAEGVANQAAKSIDSGIDKGIQGAVTGVTQQIGKVVKGKHQKGHALPPSSAVAPAPSVAPALAVAAATPAAQTAMPTETKASGSTNSGSKTKEWVPWALGIVGVGLGVASLVQARRK